MQEPTYYIRGLFRQGDAAKARIYLGIGAGTGDVTHTGNLTLGQVVVGNGLSDLKVLASPGNASMFLNGAAIPAFAFVKDTDLSMTAASVVNDVTIIAHGFCPIAPNNSGLFLDGTGVWSDPQGGMAAGLYRFSTSTVNANPGSGLLRLNAGTWAAATAIYISSQSGPGTDITAWMKLLKAGDSIMIQDRNDNTKSGRFSTTGVPTDNGGWFTIAVTNVVTNGAVPANNQSIAIVISYDGGGGGSGTVTNALNLTNNAVVVGDGGTVGVKSLAALGAAGTVLTSNGAGVPPSFQAAAGTGNVTTAVTLTDHGVIVGNAGVDVVVTAVGATNTVLHGNTGADPTFSAVVENDLALTDVTTANAAVGQHGFLKKLSNVATEYMGGDGNWSVPPGTAVDYFWDYMEASILPVGTTNSVAYNCNRTETAGTLVLPTSANPPGLIFASGTVNGTVLSSAETQVNRMIYDRPMEWHGIFSITDKTNIRFWCGLSNLSPATVGGSDTPAGRIALFRYTAALDTTFRCYTNNNSTSESLNSGITPTNGQVYRFKITWDGTTTGKIKYYIDGALVQTSGIDMTAGDVFGMYSSMTMVSGATNRTWTTYGMKSRIYYP